MDPSKRTHTQMLMNNIVPMSTLEITLTIFNIKCVKVRVDSVSGETVACAYESSLHIRWWEHIHIGITVWNSHVDRHCSAPVWYNMPILYFNSLSILIPALFRFFSQLPIKDTWRLALYGHSTRGASHRLKIPNR